MSSSWSLPSKTPGRQVYPDYCTTQAQLSTQPGSTSDPGRMGIYVCLLDDRPHLYPSLAALHKHRHVSHSIPLPGDAVDTVSAAAAAGGDGDISMSEAPPTAETGEEALYCPKTSKPSSPGSKTKKTKKKNGSIGATQTNKKPGASRSYLSPRA